MMGDLARQREAAESVEAQKLIDDFVRAATAAGLPVVDLMATTGGRSVRTNVRGWYLRRDRSIAIGVDGGYYRLSVPAGPLARLTGVRVEPSAPPLIVGRGGRDGESGDLKDFLARALAQA